MTSPLDRNDDPNAVDLPPEFCELLAAYDQGEPTAAWQESSLPSEWQERLQRDRRALDLMHQAWPPEAPAVPEPAAEPPREIGDFRILREIGRGGMGVVYEAEQLSLGRRVALKVLPFAAVLDPQQLERFKNEAQAAASLHREGIVPVYAVGCDRGVHYYAMQLVEGQTIAQWIADEKEARRTKDKKPSAASASAETVAAAQLETRKAGRPADCVRQAAELAAQAAEALEYAHEQGIVHRDVKPSNLLIDARGRAWITDFGLARVEANPALTATGDLLGTLRYMAPEQATGKATEVDHRTDIYGLGATLYEMLALRPVHDAAERGGLIRQIAEEEPRPLRGRALVPLDLETIVLKTLAHDPVDRYGSAGEMAADLRRFLAGETISARRPGVFEQAVRWLRRRPQAAASLGVALVALLVAATIALGVSRQAQNQTSAALESANDNFTLAMEAIDRAAKADQIDAGDRQEQLLVDAARLYRQLAATRRADETKMTGKERTSHLRRSDVLTRLAALRRDRGDYKAAEKTAQEAIDAGRQLTRRMPGDSTAAQALADGYHALGEVYFRARRYGEAEHAYRAGLPTVYAARERPRRLAETEAWLLGGLARVYWITNRHERAEDAFATAIAAEGRLLLAAEQNGAALSRHAGTLNDYALLLHSLEKRHEVIRTLRQAIAIQREALKLAPRDAPEIRGALYHHLCLLAREYRATGDPRACLASAREIAETLPRKLRSYSAAAEEASYALEQLGSTGTADQLQNERQAVADWLAEAAVAPEYEPEFLHRHIGLLLQTPDALTYDPQTALLLARRLVRAAPDVARYWTMLALAQTRTGDPAAALVTLDRADQADPDSDSETDLAIVKTLSLRAAGQDAEAADAFEKLQAWHLKHPELIDESPWHQRMYGELDRVFVETGPPADAISNNNQAP